MRYAIPQRPGAGLEETGRYDLKWKDFGLVFPVLSVNNEKPLSKV